METKQNKKRQKYGIQHIQHISLKGDDISMFFLLPRVATFKDALYSSNNCTFTFSVTHQNALCLSLMSNKDFEDVSVHIKYF